ncbi:MAG: hypothetical protein U0N74_08195 [Peptococcaceae bacterium]
MVNAYIRDMEAIQALEQEDRANGVVGFFAEVAVNGESAQKKAFKASSLTEALKKAEAVAKPGEVVDLCVTLWRVEGGMMREVGVFSHSAADAVWMHEYKEEKQSRPLVYSCKLRQRASE